MSYSEYLRWVARAARGRQRVAASGAIATAVPAAPGIVLATAGSTHATPLLICSGVIAIISVIANAIVKIHGNRQQTRRLEIRQEPVATFAKAIVRVLDDTHTVPTDVPDHQRLDEIASVRMNAMKAVEQVMPAVLAMIEQNGVCDKEHQ